MTKKVKEYRGDGILVTYDVKRCIHAAECVKGLPSVFDTDKRPWIQPDQAAADEVAEVVLRCPTGALHFERDDGGAEEAAPEENTVVPEPDGPLYLSGDIEIVDAEGNIILKDTRVALCRCGATENKPFCDGSHFKIAFMDEGKLPGENRLGSLEAVEDGEKLTVQPAANGPLLLQGSTKLRSVSGSPVYTGSKGALCRCGHSKSKPFCDGSHVEAGFSTE